MAPAVPQLDLGLAFDLMRVRASSFTELRRIFPALQLLFATDDEDVDSEA